MQETGKHVCYHGDVFHVPANNWEEECQECGVFKLGLIYGLDLFFTFPGLQYPKVEDELSVLLLDGCYLLSEDDVSAASEGDLK